MCDRTKSGNPRWEGVCVTVQNLGVTGGWVPVPQAVRLIKRGPLKPGAMGSPTVRVYVLILCEWIKGH